jgi:RNA polymerase sigma factor (TIGR02999 family)
MEHESEKKSTRQRLVSSDVLRELREVAARYLKKERRDHTLEPTELVHEAYLKLHARPDRENESRTHFFAAAATAVRQVLVDHARAHQALKRGKGRRMVTLHDFDLLDSTQVVDLIELDNALQELALLNPRQCKVVEMRFFGAMKIEEIATVLGVSPRTIKGTWRAARAWLIYRLSQ